VNVTEERDASEDEELSVDISRWSVSMLQTAKVQYSCHSNYYVRDEKKSLIIKVCCKTVTIGGANGGHTAPT